jgi:hypothetical protein
VALRNGRAALMIKFREGEEGEGEGKEKEN